MAPTVTYFENEADWLAHRSECLMTATQFAEALGIFVFVSVIITNVRKGLGYQTPENSMQLRFGIKEHSAYKKNVLFKQGKDNEPKALKMFNFQNLMLDSEGKPKISFCSKGNSRWPKKYGCSPDAVRVNEKLDAKEFFEIKTRIRSTLVEPFSDYLNIKLNEYLQVQFSMMVTEMDVWNLLVSQPGKACIWFIISYDPSLISFLKPFTKPYLKKVQRIQNHFRMHEFFTGDTARKILPGTYSQFKPLLNQGKFLLTLFKNVILQSMKKNVVYIIHKCYV